MRVFNTERKQVEETFHITFNESIKAIRFSEPSVEDITIVESERYPLDEYVHHFEPTKVIASIDQNDQPVYNDDVFGVWCFFGRSLLPVKRLCGRKNREILVGGLG
ncbi:hypothetical protein Tco_1057678 [Tanacetum coccineum]|uniref:Uncharacterized protein n=1 Tax=Tanacetum coccineum TaxID=301880 RepID=A0ABQ5H708_9ASTR